jgi:hypothetical protein
MSTGTARTGNVAARLGHELREYLIAALYLYVCFAAILFHEQAVLKARGLDLAVFGFAMAKALIAAKFMVTAQALGFAGGMAGKPLIWRLAYRSLAFLALLVVLEVIEEVVAGAIHGRTPLASLAELGGGSLQQILATCILLWLILLPYFLVRLIGAELGKGVLFRMFFGPR